MSVKKFARVLLPSAVFLTLVWSLATPAPAYALLTPQIVSVNPGSGSPVGSNVCITARIEQDFDYRAMHIRFGNEGWQEGTSLEFEKCFVTGHLSPGWYEIKVEADRLGGNWSNTTSATQSYELTAQPQPTQPPPPPKGPAVEFTLTPSGGADIGTMVTIEVWVDSTNPGAIRITVPCGEVPVEHTTPHFSTTWNTAGCGKGTETVRVCARDVNDPNWANQTCSERQYTLSSPPAAAPTAKFSSDATSIQSGQCTWLRWTTTNASVVDIDGDVVAASGEMQVCPTITKYYSLKAQGDGGVATRSLGINVYAAPPTQQSVVSFFKTGDVIDIEGRIHIIVNGERRWVPNEVTLDALGLGRDKVNNKGFSNSELKTIPPGPDIPDINRDYSGFMAFKNAYFPNTTPIVPATSTPSKGAGQTPTVIIPTTTPSGQILGAQPEVDGAACVVPTASNRENFLVEAIEWLKRRNPFNPPVARGARQPGTFDRGECVQCAADWVNAYPWLPDVGAYPYTWDDAALSYGLEVSQANEAGFRIEDVRVGDVVVWEPGCGGVPSPGHVAVVVGRDASGKIIVDECNLQGDHLEHEGSMYPVYACLKFIHSGTGPRLGDISRNQELRPWEEVPQEETGNEKSEWLLDLLRQIACNLGLGKVFGGLSC